MNVERYDVVCDFGPAGNGGVWWSVAGVDGPGSFINGEGRFVRGPVTGFVGAAVEGVSVFVIPWPVVFVMAVCHVEFGFVLFSKGALVLL